MRSQASALAAVQIELTFNPAATVTTTITDDADAVTATLTATGSTSEDGGSITYTVTLTGAPGAVDPDTALSFLLANGETVTIAAGAISGSVTVPVSRDDVYVETELDHELDRQRQRGRH